MAKLTEQQWEEAKVMWCIGKYRDRQIGEKFGVSHTAIQKRAKAEGWVKLDSVVVDNAIDASVMIKAEVAKVAKVANLATSSINNEIDKLANEKALLHEDATEIRSMMLDTMRNKHSGGELTVIDCKAGMEALAKESEMKFGKSPETAIQINNQPQDNKYTVEFVNASDNKLLNGAKSE